MSLSSVLPASGKYSDRILRQFFISLFPAQVLSVLVSNLGNIINGLVVGNYLSPEALVSLGFVGPITMLMGAISMIASSGARILCGKHMGRNEFEKISEVFSSAVFFLAVIGALLALIGLSVPGAIAGWIGAGEYSAITGEYIRGLAIGFIPALLLPCLMVFMYMMGDNVIATVFAAVQAACILVFSLINALALGGSTFGMGLSTSISEYVVFSLIIVRFLKSKSLPEFRSRLLSKKTTKVMISLGAPTALANILYSVRSIILANLCLSIGGAALTSAFSIFNSVASLTDTLAIAFSAVVAMVGSVILGERDKNSLKRFFFVSLRLGIIIMAVKFLLLLVLAGPIGRVFGASGEILSICKAYLPIYNICHIVAIFNYILIAFYQSLGRVRFCNILYIFSAFIIPLGFIMVFRGILGNYAIYLCYILPELLADIVFLFASRRAYGHFPRNLDELLNLPVDFDRGESVSTTVHTLEEVVTVSATLAQFCREHGVDSRRSHICALCAEEMAANIVTHGFTKGKRDDYSIDVFLMCDRDELTLRLRDNCPVKFDPKTRLVPFDPEDPTKGFGIRMVYKIAREVTYQSVFNMNVLTIKM